jgi:hypothetical protein
MRQWGDNAAIFGFHPRHFARDDAEFFAHIHQLTAPARQILLI